MKDVLTLILGGGRGTRLYPLTRHRSEPAVPLAGKYRLIDVPISNCLNSELNRVYVLTQFLSVSLHRHIAQTYKTNPFHNGFVEVLAAQQTNEAADWYQGTADALRQNLLYVENEDVEDVLVLSGDQLYRMDFGRLVETHRARRADVTIAVVPVPRSRAGGVGVLHLGAEDRVTDLVEKPSQPEQLDLLCTPLEWLRERGCDDESRQHLANMGIYLFRRTALFDLLRQYPSAMDLVCDILAPSLRQARVHGHLFTGYWEDLGTVESYYAAHMALVSERPPFDFHSPDGIIYTRTRNLPSARVAEAELDQCLLSDGCAILAGAKVRRSVIGLRGRLGAGVTMRDTVMIGAESLETANERDENRRLGRPDLGIGEGAVIERAILDKDCRIGRGVRITNAARVQEADTERYVIRRGIVVLPKGAVVPDGTVI